MTEPLLLLAVDMDLSPATHAMLLTAKSFLVQLAPQSQALLLTVIPVPYDTPSSLGRFRGQAPPCPRRPSSEPRLGIPSSWRRPCWCKGASRLDAWKCRYVRACLPRSW